MVTRATPPYACPDDSLLDAGPWVLQHPEPGTLPPRLVSWDYATRIVAARDIRLSWADVLSNSWLPSSARLAIVVTAESTSTRIRRPVFCESVIDGLQTVSIDLDPSELGGTLILASRLVLVDALPPQELAASRPGSILWEDVVRVDLEGDAARFPIELVSFKEAGLPGHAPWRIDIWDVDLEVPAGSGTRIQINSDHIRAREMALDPDFSLATRVLADVLEADVARHMLRILRDNPEIREDSSFARGSLGEALLAFQRIYLPRESISSLRDGRESEIARVEVELLSSLEVFS